MTGRLQPTTFRQHILRGFAMVSAVLICGAALLLFATSKLTEDRVLRELLEPSAHPEVTDTGVFSGALSRMPASFHPALEMAPDGYSELALRGKEVHVHKRGLGGTSTYALIALGTDSSSVPFFIALALGSGAALVLAIAYSRTVAARFSRPVERIADGLDAPSEAGLGESEPTGVVEFDRLGARITAFRHEQASRVAREASFANSVSHELRTPLTVIEGSLELLASGDDDARRDERLARIRRAADSMRVTIDTLLALTRAEQRLLADNVTFESSMATMIEQHKLLVDKRVELACEIEGYPAASSQWAPLLIALQSLTGNAARYTHQGHITVRVSASTATVSDSGVGMSPATLRRLRENRPEPGRLGYPLIHRICGLCGWRLDIHSSDRGSVIRIGLRRPASRFSTG